MFLLTTLIVKSSHILVEINLIIKKKTHDTKFQRLSTPNLDLPKKIEKLAIK